MKNRVRRRKGAGDDSDERASPSKERSAEKSSQGLPFIIKITLFLTVIISGVCLLGFYGAVVEPVVYSCPPAMEFDGPLKINNVLEGGEQLLVGNIGPESIEVDDVGNLYTGFTDGRIVKVHPSATGAIGEGLVEDFSSGPVPGVDPVDGWKGPARPLGLRLHGGSLYVIDAYYGLYSINVQTKKIKVLVKPDDVQPSMKFPNDIDITKDGKTIYFTDTSYKWNLDVLSYDLMEGSCTGRIFKLDVASGKVETMREEICFANGVQLSQDETLLAVAETSRYRVIFVDAKTGDTVKTTVVPGMPDNIRSSPTGGYWVAVPIGRSWVTDIVQQYPLSRKILSGLFHPHFLARFALTSSGLGVELDQNGDILGSVHDKEGKTCRTVSQITETSSGDILAGSYKSAFLVKTKRD